LIGSILASPADCGDEGLELRRIEVRVSELRHVPNPLQDSTFDLWQDRLHLIENAGEEGRLCVPWVISTGIAICDSACKLMP